VKPIFSNSFASIQPVAVRRPLIDMPLFLTAQHYVTVPLESTSTTAYSGLPEFWRTILGQGRSEPPTPAREPTDQ
jgi:hypothetical protein